ncbi:MAG: 6-hydroxymethylpterin diphosphokinase MptE-like protein, partial [Methanosarcinaceae archaeon]
MDFDSWEPIYLNILADFGFSRREDERAALILSDMLNKGNLIDVSILDDLISDRDILVCGNAPILAGELDLINTDDYVIITADGATAVVFDMGVVPDIIVTDLDGDVE